MTGNEFKVSVFKDNSFKVVVFKDNKFKVAHIFQDNKF